MARTRVFVIASVLAVALGLTGCNITATGPLSASPTSAPRVVNAGPSTGATSTVPSTLPSACVECTNTGTPVVGEVVIKDGVQVLEVVANGESYSPNMFTVKAGVPVRVSFSGKPYGCFKRPTFKELHKNVDISSGSGSVDLGSLAPGTYGWASALGIGPGTIVVQ
jgi:hypothetical protein